MIRSTPPVEGGAPPEGEPPARCPRCGDPLASPLDPCPCDAAFAAPPPKPRRRAPPEGSGEETASALDDFADKFTWSGGLLALLLGGGAWWAARLPVVFVYLLVRGGINLQGDYGPLTLRTVVAVHLAVAFWAWAVYFAAALGVTLRIPDAGYRRAAWAHFPASLGAVTAGFLAGAAAGAGITYALYFPEGYRTSLITEGRAFDIAVILMPVGGLVARVAYFRRNGM